MLYAVSETTLKSCDDCCPRLKFAFLHGSIRFLAAMSGVGLLLQTQTAETRQLLVGGREKGKHVIVRKDDQHRQDSPSTPPTTLIDKLTRHQRVGCNGGSSGDSDSAQTRKH